MNARDIMSRPVVTVTEESTVAEAASLMLKYGTSCLPVVDGSGKLTGIITHSDFGFHRKFLPMSDYLYTLMGSFVRPETLERVSREVSSRRIKEVMSRPVATVDEEDSVAKVADIMISKGFKRIPVTRSRELVGIITRHDLVKLMIQDLAEG
ncbi:MAG: CBS domain-containing protein [Chloroflexota bacterium]|nr:CBS domain-containing protein [Chloroflexota bacterium]MDE2941249.1 CBS domain-containing protein [Chloroflexota bacterium]MDE3267817.1 CBS domain-containing protein [Chloroflexota bacterium]